MNDTESITIEEAQQVLDDNKSTIDLFVRYLRDVGVWLALVSAQEEDDMQFITNVLQEAFSDIKGSDDSVADAAPSLGILIEYAREVHEDFLPADVIPSDDVVKAALTIFHHNMRQEVASA